MGIGLIGTGLMGAPMARRILDAGHPLTVFNRSTAKAEALAEDGATVAATPAGAVAGSEVVIVMVSDGAAVRATLLDDATRGELAGRTVLNMSTIGPAESVALGAEIESTGAVYLEAPVLGSIPQATDGSLIIMVGGDEEHFRTWRPLLECMGTDIRHIGPVGRAAALKLALNQLIASLTAAFAYSLGLVRANHVPLDHFMGILRSSALYAPTFDKKLDNMLSGDYSRTNFPARLLLKDVNLCLAEGETHGLDTTALTGVAQLIQTTLDHGNAENDYSSLAAPILQRCQVRGSEV